MFTGEEEFFKNYMAWGDDHHLAGFCMEHEMVLLAVPDHYTHHALGYFPFLLCPYKISLSLPLPSPRQSFLSLSLL